MYPCRGPDANASLVHTLLSMRECCERRMPHETDEQVANRVLRDIVAASTSTGTSTDGAMAGLVDECFLPDDTNMTVLSYFTRHRRGPDARHWKYFMALATMRPDLLHHANDYGSTPMGVIAADCTSPEFDARVRRLLDLEVADDAWRATVLDIVGELVGRVNWAVRFGLDIPSSPNVRLDVLAHGVCRDPAGARAMIEDVAARSPTDDVAGTVEFLLRQIPPV